MPVSIDLKVGDIVRVTDDCFQASGYDTKGKIIEHRPKQKGYLVQPLGTTEHFGWGYNELDFVSGLEPVSRYVRLLNPLL